MLQPLEASKGGMKVGRIKDPLYKDSYFGITPPTFIPAFQAPETLHKFNGLYPPSTHKRQLQGSVVVRVCCELHPCDCVQKGPARQIVRKCNKDAQYNETRCFCEMCSILLLLDNQTHRYVPGHVNASGRLCLERRCILDFHEKNWLHDTCAYARY